MENNLDAIIKWQATRILGCRGMQIEEFREEIEACLRIIANEAIKEKKNATSK